MPATATLARKHNSLERMFARLHPQLGLPSSALPPRRRKLRFTKITDKTRQARALRKTKLEEIDAAFDAFKTCMNMLPLAAEHNFISDIALPSADFIMGDDVIHEWISHPCPLYDE